MQDVLLAGCKINLFLRITGVREDGMHELETLFLPLPEPHDVLYVCEREAEGLAQGTQGQKESTVTVRCRPLEVGQTCPKMDPVNNTLTRACALYAEAASFAPALDIEIAKGIPAGAGLGGGSADAAILLRWLNKHAQHPLDEEGLLAVGAKVGADVPFFLQDSPCLAGGIGEKLGPVSMPERLCRPGSTLLLICPVEFVSTPWAYAAWDRWNAQKNLTKRGLGVKDFSSFCPGSHDFSGIENSFEAPVFQAFPRLRRLKEILLQHGAAAAAMSGSGSSLFGIFDSREAADAAAKSLRRAGEIVYVHGLSDSCGNPSHAGV